MDNIFWQDFVSATRKEGKQKPSRKSAAGIKRSIGMLTQTGPQKDGSPFKNVADPMPEKDDEEDISAPPGAPGGLEEDVDPESFEVQDTLEPRLWTDMELKPIVRKNLLKVAQDFIDNLPVEVDIEDITLTGSLANFNWSNYSDVDLHIIVNFLNVDENTELVKAFFDNARMSWNNKHSISVKGYDVEIYVEDEGEGHRSSGIYSVLNGEWVVRPKKKDVEINFSASRRKAEDMEFQINIVKNLITAKKYKVAHKNIERLKRKIRAMRAAGLETKAREFSVENIAFKLLRRNGSLNLLDSLKTNLYDDMMTLGEG